MRGWTKASTRLFCQAPLHQPTFTPHLSYPTFTPVLYFYTNQLLHQTPFTPTSFYTRHLLHQPAFTPDTFYNLSHKTPFTPDTFDKRQLFTPQILLHQTPFTPDAFYTKHPLHLPTFTPHLSHQTPFTSSTFYTTPGRQTKVDSSLWPQRTVPKLPSGTNGCQTLKTATLNTFYFCQKRPLCQPPPSPTPPPYSHFVRKVKLRLAYRLAFVKCDPKTSKNLPIHSSEWQLFPPKAGSLVTSRRLSWLPGAVGIFKTTYRSWQNLNVKRSQLIHDTHIVLILQSLIHSYLQLAASRFDICNFTKCDPMPAFTVGLAWGPVGPRWELTVNRTLLR